MESKFLYAHIDIDLRPFKRMTLKYRFEAILSNSVFILSMENTEVFEVNFGEHVKSQNLMQNRKVHKDNTLI